MDFTSRRELSAFSRSTSSSEAASAEAASLLIVSRSSLERSRASCFSLRKAWVLLSSCCRPSLHCSSFAMDCLAADRSFRSPGTSSAAFALACRANSHCKLHCKLGASPDPHDPACHVTQSCRHVNSASRIYCQ